MKTLLTICHCPSPNVEKIFDLVNQGAADAQIENVKVIAKRPLDATVDDMLTCDGIIVGSTANFGYMNGLLKDFFERIYYPCLDKKQGLPVSLFVKAGNDATGAVSAIHQIIKGLRWKSVQPDLVLVGDWDDEWEGRCYDFGMYMSAGLDNDIF